MDRLYWPSACSFLTTLAQSWRRSALSRRSGNWAAIHRDVVKHTTNRSASRSNEHPDAGGQPILHSSEFDGIWLPTTRQMLGSEAATRIDAPCSRRKADASRLQGAPKAPDSD